MKLRFERSCHALEIPGPRCSFSTSLRVNLPRQILFLPRSTRTFISRSRSVAKRTELNGDGTPPVYVCARGLLRVAFAETRLYCGKWGAGKVAASASRSTKLY